MLNIVFATSNAGKFSYMQRELDNLNLSNEVKLEQLKMDLTEIQSIDIGAISLFKAKQAYVELGKPVLVMDGGFYIDGLNGFPGAYTRDMVDTIPLETMVKIVSVLDVKTCHFKNVATIMFGPDDYQQFFDTTGDVFTLTDQIWPDDSPFQWSYLWRMLVPTQLGYTKPLASLSSEELDAYQLKRSDAETSCLKMAAEYLYQQYKQAA
jgi:non-canonical purine NTP pyrophosphatase (RdgB/HAM1 family)